jgi:hypothetical protein
LIDNFSAAIKRLGGVDRTGLDLSSHFAALLAPQPETYSTRKISF